MDAIRVSGRDALLIVDVQNDFLPGGALPVPAGDAVIPALNRYIALFVRHARPILATRDWHPQQHCSFRQQGGIWPPHCIAGSKGAEPAAQLALPPTAVIVSKATSAGQDAYSGFEGTVLAAQLRASGSARLFIGGLATDYCVLNTVTDALAQGFEVVLLLDAIRAVDLHAGDGRAAIAQMLEQGARPLRFDGLAPDASPQP
ncbi:isochorismatase family protein [Herminiimonas sp. CN]|uniref:isochorismatase family protein n=1 Tax=Herminiimonas sp. CN TaxID=1349818 RepID=UPI0004732B52|nr:isochorismatase family protein [Herminiimonas sp. CN]